MYVILFVAAATIFSACKMGDENGDLDGMWQLTEWRDKATNQIVKSKDDSLYYSVQQKLIKFQHSGHATQYLCTFTHTPDSLIIDKVTIWPDDEIRPISELAPYGVPSNGKFHVDVLTGNRMELSADDRIILFRKY